MVRTLFANMTDNSFPSDPGKLKEYFAAFAENINKLRASAGQPPVAVSLFSVSDCGYFAWILADAQSGEFKERPVDMHVVESPGQVQVSHNESTSAFQMRGEFLAAEYANRRQALAFGAPEEHAAAVTARLNLRQLDVTTLLEEERDLKQFLYDEFVSDRGRREQASPADASQRLVYLRLLEKGAVEQVGADQLLLEPKKRPIAGDDVGGASFESRGDVLVVIRIHAHAGELLRACNQVGQHREVLELRICASEELANLGVIERFQRLIHDGRRDHHLEARVAQEPLDQPARRAGWLDDGADVDARVEDSAEQGLLRPAARLPCPLPGRPLRFDRDLKCPVLAHRALLLPLEEFQRMPPCEASHLLQPLDRHQRGQWLALPLNDKLVVTKGDPVEQVTDPLANLDCGYFFPSVATSIVALDAGPQGASKSLSRFLP